MRHTLTVLAAVLFALAVEAPSHADADHQSYPLALAVVAANEASLRASPDDVAIVHAAASFHAATSRGRLAWLRSHSCRSLASPRCRRACRPGRNCRWSRQLWERPDQRPDALARGSWRADEWERIRAYARGLASGRILNSPCPHPIRTWGNVGDFAASPHLIAVRCGDARNLGGTTAGAMRRGLAGNRPPRRLVDPQLAALSPVGG